MTDGRVVSKEASDLKQADIYLSEPCVPDSQHVCDLCHHLPKLTSTVDESHLQFQNAAHMSRQKWVHSVRSPIRKIGNSLGLRLIEIGFTASGKTKLNDRHPIFSFSVFLVFRVENLTRPEFNELHCFVFFFFIWLGDEWQLIVFFMLMSCFKFARHAPNLGGVPCGPPRRSDAGDTNNSRKTIKSEKRQLYLYCTHFLYSMFMLVREFLSHAHALHPQPANTHSPGSSLCK